MGLMFENFKMALSSVKANKMRAFLTMLGIIIGLSSVMTTVTILMRVNYFLLKI